MYIALFLSSIFQIFAIYLATSLLLDFDILSKESIQSFILESKYFSNTSFDSEYAYLLQLTYISRKNYFQ